MSKSEQQPVPVQLEGVITLKETTNKTHLSRREALKQLAQVGTGFTVAVIVLSLGSKEASAATPTPPKRKEIKPPPRTPTPTTQPAKQTIKSAGVSAPAATPKPEVQSSSLIKKPSPETTAKWDKMPSLVKVDTFLAPKTKIKPLYIVLHWSGASNGHDPRSTYNTLLKRGLSCTFGVGSRTVLQIQEIDPAGLTVSHNNCQGPLYNNKSISIEMSGRNFDADPPPDAEVQLTYWLVHWLMKTYKISLNNVIGHFQVPNNGGKSDPGRKFLAEFKANLAEAMQVKVKK